MINDCLNSNGVQSSLSSSLQDAGFSSAHAGGIIGTPTDLSPTQSPTPMPTADFVTLLVVQSIFGVDLETAQTEQVLIPYPNHASIQIIQIRNDYFHN